MPKQMRMERVYGELDLEQKLPALIEHLQTLLERYGPDAEIDADYDGDRKEYYLYYPREETDAEEANREAEAARWAKMREKNERIQYPALKAKFEKGT